MNDLSMVQKIAVWILPVLFAITLHEVAHGWIASLCGDQTAKRLGRLTINPIAHIDLIGTVVMPILCVILGGFVFGWAKPVPVNPNNMRHPRRDNALVAIAGPISNLLMAIFWALIAKLGTVLIQNGLSQGIFVTLTGIAGIQINLMLALLNLIPIPPLDGSRVVSSLLPPNLAIRYDAIGTFGFLILIILLTTGILNEVLLPPLQYIYTLMMSLFAIH